MAPGKRKYRVLIAGANDKLFDTLSGLLPKDSFELPLRAANAGEVRRMQPDRPAEVVIINTPLSDEFGTELAADLSEGPTAVMMLVKNDMYADIAYQAEDSGILVIGKPMNSQLFYTAVKLLAGVAARLEKMEKRNRTLEEKMNDIRLVNRAKWLLIENHHMSEKDAHYYIEKQAMDTRLSRREIAQSIIRTYDK